MKERKGFLYYFVRNRNGMIGMIGVLLILLIGLVGPMLIAKPDGYTQDILQAPSALHWLGTDNIGLDIFAELVWGARTSLYVSVMAMLIAGVIGIPVGLLCGYNTGWLREVIDGFIDIFMTLPMLPLMIIIAAVMGTSITNVAIILGIFSWPQLARVTKNSTMKIREMQYIEACTCLGLSKPRILFKHMKEDHDGGLTMFGKQCVERMNKVGMLIDVSHCGQQTAYDAVMYSKKPIIMSHVGAKGVWDIKRMAGDDLIKAIGAKGGVVGIESAPHTTMSKTKMTHDLDSVMEHFEYVKNLIGIDHVGFGVDCLYGDHVGVHHAFAAALSTAETANTSYEEVPFVWGLENPTEASWNIIRWLVKHNYSEEDIGKVIGGNAIRVLREVWA